MMNVNAVSTIEINRPRIEVMRYSSNPDNAPEWYANIKSVRWLTPKPLAVGSHISFVAEFLRRRLEYVYVVTALVDGEELVMKTSDGPFPMETTYTYVSTATGSTRMMLRNRGSASGFGVLLAPLMNMMVRRANAKDLRKLKQILETGQKSAATS